MQPIDSIQVEVDSGRVIPIIDCGSGWLKCGRSGQEQPDHIIPNVIGSLNQRHRNIGIGVKAKYFGFEAEFSKQELEIKKNFRRPFQNGQIHDVDDWQEMMSYVF